MSRRSGRNLSGRRSRSRRIAAGVHEDPQRRRPPRGTEVLIVVRERRGRDPRRTGRCTPSGSSATSEDQAADVLLRSQAGAHAGPRRRPANVEEKSEKRGVRRERGSGMSLRVVARDGRRRDGMLAAQVPQRPRCVQKIGITTFFFKCLSLYRRIAEISAKDGFW